MQFNTREQIKENERHLFAQT
jgi:hypothetical protein